MMRIGRKTKYVTASTDEQVAHLYNSAPAMRIAIRNYLKDKGIHSGYSCVIDESNAVMTFRIDAIKQVDNLVNFLYEVVGDPNLIIDAVGENVIEVRCMEDELTEVNSSSSIDERTEFRHGTTEKLVRAAESFGISWDSSELRSELYTKLIEFMQTPEMGYDEQEAKQYTRLDVTFTEDNQLKIEVGAEVSYDGMWMIKEALDPIIQAVDPEAYFDMEDSGIMSAYVRCDNCVKSSSNIQGSSEVESSSSYGGDYDLEKEGFFTKDDLIEFDNLVIEILQECYPDTFRIDDSYIENNVIYLSVQSSEGNWAEGSVKVDMRKIRKPSDILKYSNTMVGKLREELDTVYVESSTTIEGTMLPGPGDYDPPDNDLEEADEVTECIDVQVDTNIIIGTDNTWDYEDDSYSWAAPDSNSDSWYSDEYPSLVLDDASGIADKVADLVMNNLPEEPGRYHLSANVSLCYSVTGVYVIDNFEGMDEDGHPNVSRELITDDAQVYHEQSKDSIEDLECTKIDDV